MSHQTTQPQRVGDPAFSLRDLAALIRASNNDLSMDAESRQVLWQVGALKQRRHRNRLAVTPKGLAIIAAAEQQAARFDAAFRLALRQVRV